MAKITRFAIVGATAGMLLLSGAGNAVAQESDDHSAPTPVSPERLGPAAQKWALLVGVDRYTEWDDLEHASRDVQALQHRLVAAGFPVPNVFRLHNRAPESKYLPSKGNIERQVELVPQLAGPDDLLLVVFCGHGVVIGGQSYLCPMDAQLDKPDDTLVALDDVYRHMAASPARHKLLVIDAARGAGPPREAVDGFLGSLAEPPEGVLVLAGCRPGQTSLVDPKRGGLFVEVMAEGLEGEADREAGDGDGRTLLAELFDYLAAAVPKRAAAPQTPTLYGEADRAFEVGLVPKYPVAAEVYPRIDGADAASVRLQALAGVNPLSLRAFNQATVHYARGDLEEAIDFCTEALRRDPDNAWAHILRALCHRALGELGKAAEDYTSIGIPLPCAVKAAEAELRLPDRVVATLVRGDRLYITRSNGPWLWVNAVWDDDTQKGWIHQKYVE